MLLDVRDFLVIHRTAAILADLYLATVVALLDGELRDVRTSPESPALKAGRVVQYSVPAAISLLFPLSFSISRERAPRPVPPTFSFSRQSSVISRGRYLVLVFKRCTRAAQSRSSFELTSHV